MPDPSVLAEGEYEAMLVSCIDPRFIEHCAGYMAGRGLNGHYSQLMIAGAGLAAVAPEFRTWRAAFWDNVGTSLRLHHIKKLIVLDHRDCGAAKLAYGEASIADPRVETETHRRVLAALAQQLSWRLPSLEIEAGLMEPDGAVHMFNRLR